MQSVQNTCRDNRFVRKLTHVVTGASVRRAQETSNDFCVFGQVLSFC